MPTTCHTRLHDEAFNSTCCRPVDCFASRVFSSSFLQRSRRIVSRSPHSSSDFKDPILTMNSDKAGTLEYQTTVDNGESGSDSPSVRYDNADMSRLGRTQELKVRQEQDLEAIADDRYQRNFHTISTFGLTCIIMGTWMGEIVSSSFSLINGGRGVSTNA